jgi:hypothetical protein
VDLELRHCVSEGTLSELDLAHVSKCALGRQQVEGFLRIFLVLLCMVLLVILVIATIVNGVAAFVYGLSKY